MSQAVSAVPVRSLADPLDEAALAHLAELLPAHVAAQRWFRAKTRTIAQVEIADVLELRAVSAYILILRLHYADGESDRYVLPVSIEKTAAGSERTAIVARVEIAGENGEAVLFPSLDDPRFRGAILQAIACEQTISGGSGELRAQRTPALGEKCAPGAVPEVDSFVSRAEQSNTSVIYRDRYILKLFRKLEGGVNPDLEIGAFLTARGFRSIPAVLGSITYLGGGGEEPAAVAILQQFVPNQGDAWKYTLDEIAGFFAKALASKRTPPQRTSEHPMDLISEPIPSEVRTFIGPYLDSAALLGKRTAEMHAALASDEKEADFVPEPFIQSDSRQLAQDLTGQADIAFELIRRKLPSLSGQAHAQAEKLLKAEAEVVARFQAVQKHPVSVPRIRHHGDYHLGQVLYTGSDFMIIDFEGEPARPLTDRRAKALALRDVAGMVRSFQYAAFAALFGQVPGVPNDQDARAAVENWAAAWNAYISATYLRAYFDEAGTRAFVPAAWGERRLLLDAFLLQKALYELAYELNNRPDWLPIPLRGILSLIA